MLLFKPKPKYDEILPPPPPLPEIESNNVSEQDFDKRKVKVISKKRGTKKIEASRISKGKLKMGKAKEFWEEIELPDRIEEFDIEDINTIDFKNNELVAQEIKPSELVEAEQEIQSAIGKIKEQDNKPSIIGRIFERFKKKDIPKKQIEIEEEHLMNKILELDIVSVIKEKITKAKESLMKYELDEAKRYYIEIIQIYNKAKPEDKAKVYNNIRDLYFERKSAEELKV